MSDPTSGLPGMLPDAGWYPDPTTPGLWRWWDGAEWTEHTHQPQGPEDEAVVAATRAATAAAVAEAAAAVQPAQPVQPAAQPVQPAATPEQPATPGLTMPDPSLADPSSFPAGYLPVQAGMAPSIQAPQYIELPKLRADRPAGYVPPVPAPFPPPTPENATPSIAGRQAVAAGFQGRGSSLQAARAVRTQAVAQKPNPVAIVSLVFGVIGLLLPVVIFALVAIFTGLIGLRQAAESYPPVGRGAATGGVVLGIISLLLTAIASMIAMADPAIRAIVLSAV